MNKYIRYIAFAILIILSIVLIWFFFIKKNPVIDQYEKNFDNRLNQINNSQVDSNNQIDNSGTSSDSVKPIIDETTVKPNDGQIIISSETKVLNEQGQELLDELSKQLEESFQTISTTTGVVDDDILDKDKDINIGE